ncbi:MAG TPA: tRNA 2-thiouridine(34) synthase MnmA [Anaerolineae bacterium]
MGPEVAGRIPPGTRVVVAMSGGVDSSVAAALLVEQGYEVIGVMLRLWAEPPLRPDDSGRITNKCCSLEAVYDARGVAQRLGIPFYVLNAERPFKAAVVDFFVEGYAAGQTPNPCLACNRQIRFGFLLDYARSLGAEYLATGHYARVRHGDPAAGGSTLWRGVDPAKDQSYVLHVLGQAELAHALFPVGGFSKPQVRGLAAERGLPTASRVDSQDLCFLADGDYRRFLADWAPEAVQPGPILDRAGRELGRHRGLPYYTVGQRSGLGIAAAQPLYVLDLDTGRNALVVGPVEALRTSELLAGKIRWIAGAPPANEFDAEVQIRYHAAAVPAHISVLPDGGAAVRFGEPVRGATPGQAAVVYAGPACLGGGLIQRMGECARP